MQKMDSFQNLDRLKQKLDSYRPLPDEILSNLHEDLVLQWTYNSNAIEGNTLTLKETKVVLEGITVGGKTMREHLEAINHREAIFYIEDLVQNKEPFSLRQIKQIHSLILKNIDDKNAGAWRSVNVTISGADHIPPEFLQVPHEMDHFITWYQTNEKTLHPVELAARVHSDFVKIHPFVDGNGRTGRLLMNLELMKQGFPAVVLPVSRRLEYYETLDNIHMKNQFNPFLKLICNLVETGFAPYWHALGVSDHEVKNA